VRVLLSLVAFAVAQAQVPVTWKQADVNTLEVPAANPAYSAAHISESDYYLIPEREIFKSYPVYVPGREPAGYQEWLKSREPEIEFDGSLIKNNEQWVAAGELVFNAPTSFNAVFFSAENIRDPGFFRRAGMPVAKDGTVPFARWVIRRKGTVELGSMGCNTCHTRVLEDGTVVPGAQGNNPGDRQGALLLGSIGKAIGEEKLLARLRGFARQFQMPWLREDSNRITDTFSLAEFVRAGEEIPAGVTARANTSIILPPQIPDLIGVQERQYLDHTGLVRQRSIGDLMRYSSLAQDLFSQDRYGSEAGSNGREMPSARYSDAQLYALAMYLYSLRPPENPHPFDAAAARGQAIFQREKCGGCHTPPLYTNNQLIAAGELGVDPRYTFETHKSTGYYKVPSLKGLWYRGPLGHQGAAASLEEWLDPMRLDADYAPTGYKGYDGKTRSIPGHPFGLKLPPNERRDLIVFLRTL
jgi:hypothetical protein